MPTHCHRLGRVTAVICRLMGRLIGQMAKTAPETLGQGYYEPFLTPSRWLAQARADALVRTDNCGKSGGTLRGGFVVNGGCES